MSFALAAMMLAALLCTGIPAFADDVDIVFQDDSKTEELGGSMSSTAISEQESSELVTEKDPTYTYTGKAIQPPVQVSLNGLELDEGTDYRVSYSNNVNAGKATVHVTGLGAFKGTKTMPFTIQKAPQPFSVRSRTLSIKGAKKAQAISPGKAIIVSGAVGRVTYTKAGGSKKMIISKEGTIVLKKTGKGTYKMLVGVTAAGDKNHFLEMEQVEVIIRVK